MGYRSQVVIGFNKKAFFKHVGENIKDFKDCDLIQQTEENVIFIWEDVKWYPTYGDVKSIMAVVDRILLEGKERTLEEEEVGMVRVGEESGDVEKIGSPSAFDICAVTNIDTGMGDDVEHDKFFAPNSVKFIRGDDG